MKGGIRNRTRLERTISEERIKDFGPREKDDERGDRNGRKNDKDGG